MFNQRELILLVVLLLFIACLTGIMVYLIVFKKRPLRPETDVNKAFQNTHKQLK